MVSVLVLAALAIGLIWAFRSAKEPSPAVTPQASVSLVPESVPLVTGEEAVEAIFIKAGCPVCHMIPGINGAEGRVGPPLLLGTTGVNRLRDPLYQGRAKTVREYVIESVVEPGVFIVPGYPPDTMPTWYGTKLSALGLEKIAFYLERQKEGGLGSTN
ncbi:hypothetical protein [Petrachloros mirabilis]